VPPIEDGLEVRLGSYRVAAQDKKRDVVLRAVDEQALDDVCAGSVGIAGVKRVLKLDEPIVNLAVIGLAALRSTLDETVSEHRKRGVSG
jgi:hypothetical protein